MIDLGPGVVAGVVYDRYVKLLRETPAPGDDIMYLVTGVIKDGQLSMPFDKLAEQVFVPAAQECFQKFVTKQSGGEVIPTEGEVYAGVSGSDICVFCRLGYDRASAGTRYSLEISVRNHLTLPNSMVSS